MKRFTYGIAGTLATLLLVAPFAASALTSEDIQAQIQVLLSKITDLKAQIVTLQTQTPTTQTSVAPASPRVCAVLSRGLSLGLRGDDVVSLQEFLSAEGYFYGSATGYFGPLTSHAVAKWQTSEGISAAGIVGPMTRDRIQARCGIAPYERFSASPQKGSAPLAVTFNTWNSGFRINTVSYTIDFGDGSSERAANCYAPADGCLSPGQNTHTYTANGSYTATLNKITDPCPSNGDPNQIRCMAAIQTEVVNKLQITVGPSACTKEYSPVCGAKQVVCIKAPCNPVPTTYSNRCMMNADGAAFISEGQCVDSTIDPTSDMSCKSWNDGCNSCSRSSPNAPAACTLMYCANPGKAYCTARFETSTNKPPVVSGFSGPTTLALNSTGTWTINASDPENGQLSYQIWWGDENTYAANTSASVSARDFVQSTTFAHAYSVAGTYTVSIVVRDSAGQETKTSSTVKVGTDGIACTMQYAPVCGQPAEPACRHSIPACMMATPGPRTYSNRCELNSAGATYISEGQCANSI